VGTLDTADTADTLDGRHMTQGVNVGARLGEVARAIDEDRERSHEDDGDDKSGSPDNGSSEPAANEEARESSPEQGREWPAAKESRFTNQGYRAHIRKMGNNPWGTRGCLKCSECRRRKTKVQ